MDAIEQIKIRAPVMTPVVTVGQAFRDNFKILMELPSSESTVFGGSLTRSFEPCSRIIISGAISSTTFRSYP